MNTEIRIEIEINAHNLIEIEINIYSDNWNITGSSFIKRMSVLFVKQRSIVCELPFGGISGKVCDSSLDRYKDRSQVNVGCNLTFFSSYEWGTTSKNTSKSAFIEGGGSLWSYISGWSVTFTANIYTPLDMGMVLLQHSLGLFHTKKLCSDWTLILFTKRQMRFDHPLGS